MKPTNSRLWALLLGLAWAPMACGDDDVDDDDGLEEPDWALGVFGRLGDIRPQATPEQRLAFERGREVATRVFTPADGLGPDFNVNSCAACHEKPTIGGSGPRYRDFSIVGTRLGDGSFLPDPHGGVLTSYRFDPDFPRPVPSATANTAARRNAIPFFGVGLIAELPEDVILAHADPDDEDGDGISGRANWDRGFVGRFGRKSQTVSIEAFIRGPLNNHVGITSDPLPEALKAALPVPSQSAAAGGLVHRQAAAPDEPLTDMDAVPDPELSDQDLFDLVSFAMLLAAPQPRELNDQARLGRNLFDEFACADCHVPYLEGPRGAIPLHSDLLIHDMGPELADGLDMGVATGSEFRTQPLWGVVATAPYMHDGRADTVDDAIRWHGGEATASRDAYVAATPGEQAAVLAYLDHLGGEDQISPGLLEPGTPLIAAGQPGAPVAAVAQDPAARQRFLAGRELFDTDITLATGLGPSFNGDGCRACHFDPVIGGAGPLDVNVMRYGTLDTNDQFIAPAGGTILPKHASHGHAVPAPTAAHNVFELRQTPSLLGMGAIEAIDPGDILALEDPEDADGDGIRGVAHWIDAYRLGRFGWKAQVPSLREFSRDALGAEVGLTVPAEPGFTFGALADADGRPDPEVDTAFIDSLTFFVANLDAPAPTPGFESGLAVFEAVGCDACHVPRLPSSPTPVAAYSDFLLHDVSQEGALGIADGMADLTAFRTPPLWGLGSTAPYMHDGSAATIEASILAHAGEAVNSRHAFEALPVDQRAQLLSFLASL